MVKILQCLDNIRGIKTSLARNTVGNDNKKKSNLIFVIIILCSAIFFDLVRGSYYYK
jgi:hypothetical protein